MLVFVSLTMCWRALARDLNNKLKHSGIACAEFLSFSTFWSREMLNRARSGKLWLCSAASPPTPRWAASPAWIHSHRLKSQRDTPWPFRDETGCAHTQAAALGAGILLWGGGSTTQIGDFPAPSFTFPRLWLQELASSDDSKHRIICWCSNRGCQGSTDEKAFHKKKKKQSKN